jgi:hypothetical protein
MTDKEAMKLALFALDIVKIHYTQSRHINEAIAALKERLAQPEQEPVAWMWRVKNFCDWPNWSVSLKRPADSGHAQYPRTEGYEDIPLYTAPPQRTWVGLTDEEIDYIYVEHSGDGGPTAICEQFAKAYEAKLKEKNT